mgnify:CR=1 FL=1
MDEITEDMVLARPVFGDDGRILLSNGVKLSKTYIERLNQMDYDYLYVYLPGEKQVDFTAPLSDQTTGEAIQSVKDSFVRASKSQHLDLDQVNKVIEYILDEILANPTVLFNIMDLKNHNNYCYHHSVNVCIISTIIGRNLGLARDKLKELAIGALLHDLGMVCIDPEILTKPGRLSEKEMDKVKEHSKFGFNLLRGMRQLSVISAHAAYQHHEREDGSGYPKGLTGENIHLYGKIVAVADSYDAMTSQRVYKKALWSHEAIEELRKKSPEKYDPDIVEAMTGAAAIYPVGSIVMLSTGEKAVVVDVSTKKITIQFSSGSRINAFFELETDSPIRIERRLS